MLVLARKVCQRILIGRDIEITVLGIRGDQVRLGITAPRDVSVYREELLPQVSEGNGKAPDTAQDTNMDSMLPLKPGAT